MPETIMELNNLSLDQIRNDILQDYVGETEITFFLYDALGKLLLSCPDEDELKAGPSVGADGEQMIDVGHEAALAALKRKGISPQPENRCIAELIQRREQIHGVLVGILNRSIDETQVIPFWKTVMRSARRRIETLMGLQEEMDDLSVEIIQSYRELGFVNRLCTRLAGLVDLERVYQVTLEETTMILEADCGCIFDFDKSTSVLRVVQFYPETIDSDVFQLAQLGVGLVGKAAENRESILIDNARHPMWRPQANFPFTPPLMCCALQIGQNPLGVIVVAKYSETQVFTAGDLKILEAAALQSAAAIMNVELLHNISQMRQAELQIQASLQEKKALLELMQEAKDNAEAANRSKSTFLANMSHELRTPLNAIIGYSEMLMEDAEDLESEDFVLDLQKIHMAGKQLLALINDILDISKIEAGKMELYLETFEISSLIQEVVETVQPSVEKNQNTLEVHCPENLGTMHTDLTKLRQCLLNLLSNACKFTEHGKISLTISRDTINGRELLCCRVGDTGIGMTPEQVEQVFEAFLQGDASTTRKYGGTGLGLAISQKFCEMMGGSMVVDSELGVGSTFTIRLPTQASQPQTQQIISADESDTAATPIGTLPPGRNTVLVIDDDPATANMIERFLAQEGFHVVAASGGKEGLEIARESHPVAIILDVMMPDMDGWEVLAKLKNEPELVDIPVLLLTMVNEQNKGYALGASDYLNKPIDRNRLAKTLQKYKADSSPGQVLIVEDDATTREMMRRMLEAEGWSVTEAENGRIALEQVVENRPTLILLDLMMPEVDGFEFVMALRQAEAWRSIPVVVVTAKDLTQLDRLQLKGYVERILQKGAYSRDELLHEVRELLKRTVDTAGAETTDAA